MKKLNYVVVKETLAIIFIADTCVGMSITNDAEEVVKEVAKLYGNRRIIYKDTDGRWDELHHVKGTFIDFKLLSEAEFKELYG